MTLERAADLVARLRNSGNAHDKVAAVDLAEHFIKHFDLDDDNRLMFMGMCGWISWDPV